MALNLGEIYLTLTANTSQARSEMAEVSKTVTNLQAAGQAAAIGLGIVGAALGFAGMSAIKAAADLEQIQISFEVMTGSASKAAAMITDLYDMGAKTPYESKDLINATNMMMLYGISADEAKKNLMMLGDVAAGNAQKLYLLTYAFSQIQSNGRLVGEDLRQLVSAGFNPLKIMSEQTGKSMATLKGEMEKGAISSQMVADAFKIATSEGGQFYKMMDKQSQTIGGLWSNVTDNVNMSLVAIGQQLVTTFDLKNKMEGAISWLSDFRATLQNSGIAGALNKMFPPGLAPIIVAIAGAVSGLLVAAFIALATAAWAVIAPLLPFIAIGAAIAVLALAIYTAWETNFLGIRDLIIGTWETMKSWFNNIINAVAPVVAFFQKVWQGAFNLLFDLIKNAINAFYKMYQFGANIVSAIQGKLDISKVFSEGMNVDFAQQLFDNIGNIANTTFENITGNLTTFGANSANEIKNLWEAMGTNVQEMFVKLFPNIKELIPNTPGTVNPSITTVPEDKYLKVRQNLSDKIKQLTMSEKDYQIWALDQEWQEFQKTYGNEQSLVDQFATYYVAKMDEIEKNFPDLSTPMANWKYGLQTSMVDWDNWGQHIQNIASAAAQGMNQSFQSVFVDGLRGELKSAADYFQMFVDSIMQAWANAMAQMMTSQAMNSNFMGWLGSPFGGGGGGTSSPAPTLIAPPSNIGIASIPTSPAFAASGMNAAGAPNGGMIVNVNVINQTSQPVTARRETSFDGKQYVTNVILEDVARRGPIGRLLQAGGRA